MNIRIRPSLAVLSLAVLPLAILGAIGCRPADPTLVKIVSSLPRTGSAKQQSDTIVRGIRMAIEEAGGRAGPFRVEYLDLDDATAAAGQWTSETEAANARRALQDPDVMVYVGTFNGEAFDLQGTFVGAETALLKASIGWKGAGSEIWVERKDASTLVVRHRDINEEKPYLTVDRIVATVDIEEGLQVTGTR